MIIDCPHCDSKVDGAIKGEVDYDTEVYGYPAKAVLVECPSCDAALLGECALVHVGGNNWDWGPLTRVWPERESWLDRRIPDICRDSLVEARLCFKAKAYSACAVMVGRTLEGICRYHKTRSKTLARGLDELLKKKVIDDRLYEWGTELRKHRNIGAHATEVKISGADARDTLNFATAMCEYVFVLTEQFQEFKDRQQGANE